jgi:hypothetical protein
MAEWRVRIAWHAVLAAKNRKHIGVFVVTGQAGICAFSAVAGFLTTG